jgi:hypothetical protein
MKGEGMARRLGFPVAIMLLLALVGAACAREPAQEPQPTAAAPVTKGDRSSFYIAAADQESDGSTLMVDEVVLTGANGFVAIHADAGGAPGPVIGHSTLLQAGTSMDVEITLDNPLETSVNVFPMLHVDDGNGTYEFPGPDGPAQAAGEVVVVSISVTLE